ncbi:MAG: aminotransferase [Hyphomicrobium sp.]|uniref:aminotransferase n=1 Tax=Hyphomicrobium sp. TaxID=82 RepID=UPI003D096B26
MRNLKYDTKELWRQDRDHYVHPWTDFSTFNKEGSEIIAESEGIYVYDSDGQRYIDGIGGLWCVNIGYGRDEMAQAIAEQAKRMCYYSTFTHITTPPAAALAAKLAELAPGPLNHVFYTTGGSESNDVAVRTVHFYFNRLGKKSKKKIISRIDGYHGSTLLTATITGVMFDRIGFDTIDDLVHHIPCPNPYRRPDGMTLEEFGDQCIADLESKILELGPENVAMFFAEPIMGAGGVIVPPPGYHRRAQEVCAKYDVFYLSDEVVTAFGRLGHFFASKDKFDLQPDIISTAKGITSGYQPLGAMIFSDKIYEVISVPQAEGAMFTNGFTYSGHAVTCAAGLKNIEIMEREDICGHVRKVGPYFEKKLHEAMHDLPIVGDIRGSHFMLCAEYVADRKTKALLPPEADIGGRIARIAKASGAIVRPLGHLNVLSPPLIMTEPQIDELVAILRASTRTAMDELKREKLWNG